MITDRTTLPGHHGDCYIVTGSIGPKWQPRLFKSKSSAMKYAKVIDRDEDNAGVPYKPVVEFRYHSEMFRMGIEP